MPERQALSGQWIESRCVQGPAHTERRVIDGKDEALEAWRRRHEEAIQQLGGLAPGERR